MKEASARLSWGRLPFPPPAHRVSPAFRSAPLTLKSQFSYLPYGNGRSYGDSCLNPGQGLIEARGLDKFIDWDPATGHLTCEAGVLLPEIIRFALPRGWFLPVTPGTQFVTLGGAIANDVHGKNHHVAGSIGHHVEAFELLRSDGTRLKVDRSSRPEWFRATVGGLGLTGLITSVTLRLKKVPGPGLAETMRRFPSLDAFFEVDEELKHDHEYTVAWIDCAAPARQRGRGIYMAANHAPSSETPASRKPALRVPIDPPFSLVGPMSLRAFNQVYFHRPLPAGVHMVDYQPFFYPLDGVLEWNRIYGPRGFFQFQCVLPPEAARDGINDLLDRIASHGAGSFLAVLKTFGDLPSEGLLSFPRPGATLALDFPNRGETTLRLFAELEAVVLAAGGALYPAKDAQMSPAAFRSSFPGWQQMLGFIDPNFSSHFWRRVTASQ